MLVHRTLAVSLLLMAATAGAQQKAPPPEVKTLMTKPMAEYPGKEAVMIEVTYPPGGADPVHRHDAYGFIYVLEGTVQMAVRGGPTVTLKPGETFYEDPKDVHTIGRNASNTEPAKFTAVLIKKTGEPLLTPVQ